MKQTIAILTALAAVLLLATGFIVADNLEMNRISEAQEKEIRNLNNALGEKEETVERLEKEQASAAETLKKSMEECDALRQQLNDAALASQEANAAVEQQIRRNEKQLQELEALAAEYEDLSDACDALEMQILLLSEEASQAAVAYESQTLSDAQRIAELEDALKEALAPTPSPILPETPRPVIPLPFDTFVPLVTVTPGP